MQAISGLPSTLGCTDCKTNFTSASSLLKHFAEHIAASCPSHESESEDAPSESILERALRSPASTSASSPSQATSPVSDDTKPLDVEFSNELSITKVDKDISTSFELETCHNNNIISNKHMYVKLDLQKRVENCVLNLTGDSEGEEGEDSSKVESADEVPEVEEFNPLKFCVVTLEEGSERLELTDLPGKVVPAVAAVDPQQQYKKYVCTYCSKRFGWSTDLKRHILTHTGERPFQCQLCGATFTRNFLLQKHVLKLHKQPAAAAAAAASAEEHEARPAPDTPPDVTTAVSATVIAEQTTLKDSSVNLAKRRKHAGILAEGSKS